MDTTQIYAIISGIIGKEVTEADADIAAYLTIAQDKVMARLYPFGTKLTEVPEQYQTVQAELAARLYLRAGAEGQTVSVENGVHRHFQSVNDEDILQRLTPHAKLL